MKVIILSLLLATCVFAAPNVEEIVEAKEHETSEEDSEFNVDRPKYTQQGFLINYNLACSNRPSCYCSNICNSWQPCNCACPPPCPPATTTTTTDAPVRVEPKCENGAPDFTYPHCCYNGGRGTFCCLNGANNLHCCLNGANNPWCSLPTQPPPVQTPPGGNPPGNDCNQCRCQPCMPWVPCQPCPCQQQCGGGWGK